MATQISLPPPELKQNADGSTTEVFFRVNDAGRKVKVTRKVTVALDKVSTPEERLNWPRYGAAKIVNEDVAAQKCEPINLRLVPKSMVAPKDEEETGKKTVRTVTCRFCGGDHLSFKCPLKDKIATPTDAAPASGPAPPVTGKYVPPSARGAPPPSGVVPGVTPGKYVPPGLAASRAAGGMGALGGAAGFGSAPQRDESATLRVTNLSDNVTEEDLGRNFGRAGRVKRCNVVKNRNTGLSRGFAFVEFYNPGDAERARQMFNGVAAGSMIMHVDFSEPRK